MPIGVEESFLSPPCGDYPRGVDHQPVGLGAGLALSICVRSVLFVLLTTLFVEGSTTSWCHNQITFSQE
jgi:hypothetical protein